MTMLTFVLIFAGLWTAQMVLSWRQAKRFMADVAVLRSRGTVSVGRGKRRGMRTYVALALRDGEVADSRILNGYTVFARARPLPELTGASVGELMAGTVPGLDRRTSDAAAHAATLYAEQSAKKKRTRRTTAAR